MVTSPGHIELLGPLECPLVTVGRPVQQKEFVPFAELLAVKVVIPGHRSPHVEHW